jgi:hypothetical protein
VLFGFWADYTFLCNVNAIFHLLDENGSNAQLWNLKFQYYISDHLPETQTHHVVVAKILNFGCVRFLGSKV